MRRDGKVPQGIVTAALAALLAASAEAGSAANGGGAMPTDGTRAARIMQDFAERTGLSPEAAPQRYLWTDAFALMNFLELYRETGDRAHAELAAGLIGQVHGVLGRHRAGDPRTGWLSGLPEEEGARHPTRGGLRIGKPLPERPAAEPVDERLEWDRDGQYFHYLTKWMDALARAAAILEAPRHHAEAVELADSVLPRFLLAGPSGRPVGLAWKMSIDLSRPQVFGMSPHDALDGYVTFRRLAGQDGAAALEGEIAVLRELSAGQRWATSDPLGTGGLLVDAFRLAVLPDRSGAEVRLAGEILAGADAGLRQFLRRDPLDAPAARRLGFRELGLAIGLQALPAIAEAAERSPELSRAVGPHLDALREMAGAGPRIVRFWSDPANREAASWREHLDINEVMLATALLDAQTGTAAAPGRKAD